MDDTCANPSWTVLIVYKCVSRALWASCVYTFAALNGSVFSEAFLVLVLGEAPGRSCVYIVDFSGIARSVFLDLIAINLSCCRFIKAGAFRDLRPHIVICCVKMVLIDSAWKELSNGGHVVFWSILDI